MARDFVGVDRGQLLLMPPSLQEWLPEDHLVWTVLGAVEQMDLVRFSEAYRLGGAGRPPYDPAVLVALLLYSYARGLRSSRQIERACFEDVAFKVITGMRCPDHSTIAEFRKRHETEIGGLFDEVLGLCREAGLVSVGVIAIDGTKIKANASMDSNRGYRQIVGEILREADETDRAEDELYGDARGDELPEQLRTAEGRKQALADAKRRLEERRGRPAAEQPDEVDGDGAPGIELDRERFMTYNGGRRNWTREGRRELENQRERERRPIPRDRDERLLDAAGRLEEDLQVEIIANRAYDQWRREGSTVYRGSRRSPGGPTNSWEPPVMPDGRINTTDPDSRMMRSQGTTIQGYNAQAAVTADQVIIAAEVTLDPGDFTHLEPMVDATRAQLATVGITDPLGVIVADAGYWHTRQLHRLAESGVEVLVAPDGGARKGTRPGWNNGLYQQMRDKLQADPGRALYRQRKTTIEPVFGQIKYNRHIDRFMRRGRSAARSEWRLTAATHNLLKLHHHWIANTT
jgi:transposase